MVKSVRRPDGDASCRFVVKLDKREVVVTAETPEDAARWVVALEKAATAVRVFFAGVGGSEERGGGGVATVSAGRLWLRPPLVSCADGGCTLGPWVLLRTDSFRMRDISLLRQVY